MFLTVVLFQYVWVSESYHPSLPKQNPLWESDKSHGSYSQKNEHVYIINFTYYSQGYWMSDLNQISLAVVLICKDIFKIFQRISDGLICKAGWDWESGHLVSDPSSAVRKLHNFKWNCFTRLWSPPCRVALVQGARASVASTNLRSLWLDFVA